MGRNLRIYAVWYPMQSRYIRASGNPLLVLAHGDMYKIYSSSYDKFYVFCWWYGGDPLHGIARSNVVLYYIYSTLTTQSRLSFLLAPWHSSGLILYRCQKQSEEVHFISTAGEAYITTALRYSSSVSEMTAPRIKYHSLVSTSGSIHL